MVKTKEIVEWDIEKDMGRREGTPAVRTRLFTVCQPISW